MKFFIVVIFGLCSFLPTLSSAVTVDYSFIPIQNSNVISYHIYYTKVLVDIAEEKTILLKIGTKTSRDDRIHHKIKNLEKNNMYLFTVAPVTKNGIENDKSYALHFSTEPATEISIMKMTQVDKFRAQIKRID